MRRRALRSGSPPPSRAATVISFESLLKSFPLVQAWSDTLLADDRVTGSVVANFEDEFHANLVRREFYVASLMKSDNVAAE